MKLLKEKKGIIISFIIGVIIASSITVYATSYFANEISYTKPGTETAISVETALNDLYAKVQTQDKVILSINQTVSLTTSYTSTTLPVYYNNDILSYNSENNTYTFLKDFNGKLYIAQGWIQGVTGSKMNVQVNTSNIISNHHFENKSSAFNYAYEFKKDDTLKFYSKFDATNTTQVPISIILIKN